MKFLVTGLPRMRSAWLSVLFDDYPVRCFHDLSASGGIGAIKGMSMVGVCDPCAPLMYPDEALRVFDRFVIVAREPSESRVSFERWYGQRVSWNRAVEALDRFANRCRHMTVPYRKLDEYEVVASMYRYCTDLSLSRERFDRLSLMKIEQHREKAREMRM